jgi:GSH-dependent disulfide-bond oxidoreductase
MAELRKDADLLPFIASFKLGQVASNNRIVMALMTRRRATDLGHVPYELPVKYFASNPSRTQTMLDLYTDATPNGLKISICLEELGLQYNVHRVFLGGEQKTPEFTRLNPNNKIPVLVDDGFVLSESGAILIYLAEKTGKLLPTEPKLRARAIEAVMFQMASLGPMFGQLLVFAGAWKSEFPKVTGRYVQEVNRILTVLETRLQGQTYFVGDEFTIADIAMLPWIRAAITHPIGKMLDISGKAGLNAWWERVSTRPAVVKGLSIPEPFPVEKQMEGFVKATVGLGDLHG